MTMYVYNCYCPISFLFSTNVYCMQLTQKQDWKKAIRSWPLRRFWLQPPPTLSLAMLVDPESSKCIRKPSLFLLPMQQVDACPLQWGGGRGELYTNEGARSKTFLLSSFYGSSKGILHSPLNHETMKDLILDGQARLCLKVSIISFYYSFHVHTLHVLRDCQTR